MSHFMHKDSVKLTKHLNLHKENVSFLSFSIFKI